MVLSRRKGGGGGTHQASHVAFKAQITRQVWDHAPPNKCDILLPRKGGGGEEFSVRNPAVNRSGFSVILSLPPSAFSELPCSKQKLILHTTAIDVLYESLPVFYVPLTKILRSKRLDFKFIVCCVKAQ